MFGSGPRTPYSSLLFASVPATGRSLAARTKSRPRGPRPSRVPGDTTSVGVSVVTPSFDGTSLQEPRNLSLGVASGGTSVVRLGRCGLLVPSRARPTPGPEATEEAARPGAVSVCACVVAVPGQRAVVHPENGHRVRPTGVRRVWIVSRGAGPWTCTCRRGPGCHATTGWGTSAVVSASSNWTTTSWSSGTPSTPPETHAWRGCAGCCSRRSRRTCSRP